MPRQTAAQKRAAAESAAAGSKHQKDGSEGTGRDGANAQKATVGIRNRSQDPENDAGRGEPREGRDRLFTEDSKPRWDANQPSLADQMKSQRKIEAEIAGVDFAETETDFAPTGGNNRSEEEGGESENEEEEEEEEQE